MRKAVLVSVISILAAVVPAAAFAAEPLELHTHTAGESKPESEEDFLHRPQLVLSADGNNHGLGLRVGLRYRFVELSGGTDLAMWDSRSYGELKLFVLPDLVVMPYAFGRLGHWSHSGFYGESDRGEFRTMGGGLEVRPTRHTFLFLEVGHLKQKGRTTDNSFTAHDANLGFGFRI